MTLTTQKRWNTYIPRELDKAVRLQAVEEGLTLSEITTKALSLYLGNSTKEQAA